MAKRNQHRIVVPSDYKGPRPKCPECGAPMKLKLSPFKFRSGDDRFFWGCSTYPKCTGVHGAHPDGRPLGNPADKATREARQEAHRALEFLQSWMQWERPELYRWLSNRLKIDGTEAHIAKFDQATCARVMAEVEAFRQEELTRGAPKQVHY